MKNKLTDLNNHLFEELERLGDEETKGESLQEEISRAKAISLVSEKIIKNAELVLEAHKFLDEAMDSNMKLPILTD